mmetsp:Transcript_145013/g.250980  ORF Transcript_145013/g.250980 Transcript_145013/m.250980 type:complete len:919 (-) Transcript_145013:112-2868(-)
MSAKVAVMPQYRVDHDSQGNAEVSPPRPRKLRPLEDEDGSATPVNGADAPKSAMKKSALKCKSPENSTDLEPKPPAGSPTKKGGLKSALKGGPARPEPEEEQSPAPTPTKSALKSAMKSSPSPVPPSGPPPKSAVKSALKSRAVAPEPPADEPPPVPLDKDAGFGKSGRSSRGRPSLFRMELTVEDPEAWTTRGLCKHYYYFSAQKSLWDEAAKEPAKSRKSIKLDDLSTALKKATPKKATAEGKEGKKLTKSQSFIIEDSSKDAATPCVAHGEISPLKELFCAKKPDPIKIRTLLTSLEDNAKWINVTLDATPPPMPTPLIHAVAGVHANIVEVLIEFGVDVQAQYQGKSMLKGWIKPLTPLVECVQGRKARFVGTMLGDKLETIEGLLKQAAKKAEPASPKPEETDALLAPKATEKVARRKSVQMRCSQGMMEHTHDHPNVRYELVGTHNDGNPSNVREALNILTSEMYAIKADCKVNEASVVDPEAQLWNEINIIRKLDHPNIVRLHETFEDDTHIFMVLEGCLGGELFDRLVTDGSFPEHIALRLGYQTASAMQHLNQMRICHRDIQPECFFLAEEGPLEKTGVKLLDFSMAREFAPGECMTTKVCTLHYVAPEIVITTTGYTEKVDIWSFGVLLYIMLAGFPPFNGESEMEILAQIKAGDFEFSPESVWSSVSDQTKDVIKRCLVVNPDDRLDHYNLMQHPALVEAKEKGAVYVASDELGRVKSQSDTEPGSKDKSNAVKTAFNLMAEKLTDEEVEELRLLFREEDKDSTGMVDLEVVTPGIKEIVGRVEESEELLKVLSSAGFVGRVNYTMYFATMSQRRRALRREAAWAVFNNFDIDKNGNVSLYEIAQALAKQEDIVLSKASSVSANEVMKIWLEMKSVWKIEEGELADKEMNFEEFFLRLPNSNKDFSY